MRSARKRATRKADTRALALACSIILTSRDDRSPFEIDVHKEVRADDGRLLWKCKELEFWADDETLLTDEELEETEFFNCYACAYLYQLWVDIIDATGSASYGRRAQAAFALEEFIENFQPDMREIDALDYRDLRIVRAERARIEAQKTYERNQANKTK